MAAVIFQSGNSDRRSFTERLVEMFFAMPSRDVSPTAVDAAVRCIEDTIGVGIAAASLGVATSGAHVAKEVPGSATVWGFGHRTGVAAAALANGMLAHGLDFDDTHPAAIMHASAVNVPVALALGQELGTSPTELLASLVLSYEISARLGRLGPGPFQDHGFQSTAVLGVFAATFLAARLHRVSPAVAVEALGVAGSMASGLMEYLADGSDAKQLHPGWAAQSGIQAVALARAGLTGPRTVLEGRFGVFRAYAGLTIEPESVLQPCSNSFEVELMAPKPYPACLCVHPLVQAALDLRQRGVLTAERMDDMVDLHCEVPPWYVNLVFEPVASKLSPRTAYEGRFSAPFCVARAVLDGSLGVHSFGPDRLDDARMRAIAGKITYSARTFSEFPASFPALIRLRLRGGETHESFVPHNLGSSRAPLRAAEIETKFRDNVESSIGTEAADRLHDAIASLPRANDADGLWAALAGARADMQ